MIYKVKKAVTVPYHPKLMKDLKVDPLTTMMIKEARQILTVKDDDFLMMVVGTPGSGKSDFSMWCYEIYDPEGCSIDYIGLDKPDFAGVVQRAKNKDGLRYANYDEANVTRQDHASKWNKDLLKLYWAIRGLKIFSNWNNPSAKKTPREFIEERIKAFVFIFEKVTTRPRKFYYFTKEQMIKLYDLCKGDLSHSNILKYGEEYANHIGWFKRYDGKMRQDYDRKKESRMDLVVEDFFTNYGSEDMLSPVQVGKLLGYSETTIRKWLTDYNDKFILETDYFIQPNGWVKITSSGIDKLRQFKTTKSRELRELAIENNKLKMEQGEQDG